MGEEPSLRRELKNRHMQLISLGGIIGSGYFLGSGYVLEAAGPGAILSYMLGGAIALAVMLCLGEMAVHTPISGSFITYSQRYVSKSLACGVGWSYWLNWVFYIPSEMIAAGIIMNNVVPSVDELYWVLFFSLLVTLLNIFQVDKFGECEFWLSLIKVVALVVFSIVALLICMGIICSLEPLGTSVLLGSGGFLPKGFPPVLMTMVIILVNFQGSEIIGLTAGECKDPVHSIPLAVRNVTFRVVGLYIIPIMLLMAILPWDKASLEESIFTAALNQYGLTSLSSVLVFVILTAAISCANSGLYANVRTFYALAKMDMAPRCFAKLSNNGIPARCVYFTIACCWLVILLYTLDTQETFYTYLLAVSGFTGALAWIAICWSEYRFRRDLRRDGLEHTLKYKVPFFPYLPVGTVIVQVICLIVMLFTPELQNAFYAGVPMMVLPMLWYKWREHRRRATSQA